MAKATTSFRLSDTTKELLDALADLFKESQTEIIERAVKLLYEDRERIAKADMEQRLANTKRNKVN
ncbi:ribbon-helix-helix protein, CopG family [Spirosoma sp. BT702]|uniref:Ribbon-helix-helix protein, CopG family n=1 Tax=Spirosoma profusum TaxID=2771354 RepID=A0A926XXG3_9BACT|nr:ribbon-helix-helix protein, CopG family [Spirosoma profusum]MBD2702623.1 ribbon-helix-helix protein, CopG family [Spirosoma profusum]